MKLQAPAIGRPRDWLELCRLPNVFTAVADPLAGALIAGAGWRRGLDVAAVVFASACLYTAGILLNDWYDYRKDLRERPARPLPSGRVSRWLALLAAVILLACGTGLAWLPGKATGAVGTFLLLAIVAYDVLLKDVPIAPAIMGACRSLNLLLGISVVPLAESQVDGSARAVLATIIGVYILGVTLFGRREVRGGSPRLLLAGAVASWVAVACVVLLPQIVPAALAHRTGHVFALLLMAALGYRMTQALLAPEPAHIQRAVTTAVLGVIVLDAAMLAYVRGPWPAVAVALLLVPAVWLGRWLYTT